MGNLEMGVVKSYDAESCTAEVTSYDGTSRYTNVAMLMTTYDNINGVYSYTPPSIGAPCIFTKVNGEVIIVGQYAPPNLGYSPSSESPINSSINRSVNEQQDGEEHLPGDWQITSQSGALISLRNMIFNIKMNPLFYSSWNLLNSIWDSMCNIFKFHSPGADVLVDVDASGGTSTSIQVRTNSGQVGGTPMVDLQISPEVDVVSLKINGNAFCKINKDRNVVLDTGTVKITAEGAVDLNASGSINIDTGSNVNVNAANVIVTGSLLDCSGVGRVKLPR